MGIRTLHVGSATYNPARVQQVMAGVARASKISEVLEACWHEPVLVEPQGLKMVVFVNDKCGIFEFADGDELKTEEIPVFYREKSKVELAQILFWKSERDSVYQPFRLSDIEGVIEKGLQEVK